MVSVDILWNQYLNGNLKSFEYFFKAMYPSLYGYGFKICPNETMMEDAVQDLFMHVYEKREDLSHVASIKAYLLASLRRRILQDLKTRRKYFSDQEVMVIGANELSEQQHNFGVHHELLAFLLQTLSARQREVLYLKYYNEVKISEIAQIMEITPQSVSNTLQKAIVSLRKIIEERKLQEIL